MKLLGQRYIQIERRSDSGNVVERRKIRRVFMCEVVLSDGAGIVEMPQDRPIHLSRNDYTCVACGERAYPYFDYADRMSWSKRDNRCNVAYIP